MNCANPSQRRFFIALLPPPDIQAYATEIKQQFCDRYHSKAALRSPPHITLQPPFEWPLTEIESLRSGLQSFAARSQPFPMTLSGFGAFAPRVIYINVLRTPELLDLQQNLMAHLEATLNIVDQRSKQRRFAPHLTVAFRDLKPACFRKAWPEFESRSLEFHFPATQLTLLLHDGQRWNPYENFEFGQPQPK